MSDEAQRGTVTRFEQVGGFSAYVCGGLAIALTLTAFFARPAAVGLGLGAAIGFACALLLARLTIEVDDGGVRWFFTGGFFGSRLAFSEIGTMSTRTIVPMGWGYRVGFHKRLWFITGNAIIAITLANEEMEYQIGADDPEAVREEIERRAHR